MTTEEKESRSHQANRERGREVWLQGGSEKLLVKAKHGAEWREVTEQRQYVPTYPVFGLHMGGKVVTTEERGGWQNNNIKKEKKMK